MWFVKNRAEKQARGDVAESSTLEAEQGLPEQCTAFDPQ
jgi:hypothetical protein